MKKQIETRTQGPGIIYKAVQVVQIFGTDRRAGGRKNLQTGLSISNIYLIKMSQFGTL